MMKLFRQSIADNPKPVRSVLVLFSKADKIKLSFYILLQLFTSLLDTVSILLMGSIASIGISIVSNSPTDSSIEKFLRFLHLESLSLVSLILWISSLSIALFTLKSFLSLLISYKTLKFLANRATTISASAMNRFVSTEYSWIRKQNPQEVSFTLTEGLQAGVVGVLGSFVTFSAECGMLTITTCALIFVNPIMTIGMTAYFGLFGLLVYLSTGKKMSEISKKRIDASVLGMNRVREVVSLYPEITTLSVMSYFQERFRLDRQEATKYFAIQTWIQQIPRISVELGIVIGAAILAFLSTLTASFVDAIPNLLIFLVAASRLAPSALRLQQSAISIKGFFNSIGSALGYFELPMARSIKRVSNAERFLDPIEITINNLVYQFPDATAPVLHNIDLALPANMVVALVGPSGSGKSTFCDLLLGLHEPTSGEIYVNSISLKKFIDDRPGVFSYLPQDVQLISGSVTENVAVGIASGDIDSFRIWQALEFAQLSEMVRGFPSETEQIIGVDGIILSGGQRQRLGLARAYYSAPRMLILDEPTSSLDATTEDSFMQALQALKEDCLILVIAHRLSTVQFADQVIYMEDGHVVGQGTFDELRALVPQFDSQVRLQSF